MMKKILFVVGVVALVVLAFYGVSKIAQKTENNSQKITSVMTLFPLYDFAKNIGQDKIEVFLLLPPGVEPHSFEPKPSDIVEINESDIFIYTGKFMEVWAEDVLGGVSNKNLKVVDTSEGINLIPSVFHDEDEPAGSNDPHIWLDFANAQKMTDTIANALVETDPENADFYKNNANEYKEKLIKLDNDYQKTLASCQSKEIVYGGHYAFGYLAKRYGLSHTAAQGFSPDSEPTANDLIKLVEQIKKDDIKYVFYEELSSPKIAETLAKETNTQMLPLNSAHNLSKEDYENGASYISLMEDNLKNLSLGLNCSE